MMKPLLIALLLAGCAPAEYVSQTYVDVPYHTPQELADGVESVWHGKARQALDECYGKVDGAIQTRIAIDTHMVNCMAEKGFAFRIVRERRKGYEK